MSSRVRSGRVHAPRRFARPALVAVVVVSAVGVVGVVVGVERGVGEERRGEGTGTGRGLYAVYCLMALEEVRMDGRVLLQLLQRRSDESMLPCLVDRGVDRGKGQ